MSRRAVDFVWTEDGQLHRIEGPVDAMMKASVFPEQIEALERRFGSPVVRIALDDEGNEVWSRE